MQVRQREPHQDVRGALRQPFAAHLGVAEETFDRLERVFHTRASLRLPVFPLLQLALVGFQFAHRGRYPVADVMRFTLTDLGPDNLPGTADDTVSYTQVVTDAMASRFYTGTGILTLGNTARFSFASISSGGPPDGGNFIDAADFGFGVGGSAPASIPTLSEWGMILLFTLLAFGAIWSLRRQRH